MLKSVHLKNFKLHEDTRIDAAQITVFIGPNNSGKSSIFQALLLLRQAASRNDRYLCQLPSGIAPQPSEHYLYSPNVIVDVGTFDEVVRRGSNEIVIHVCGVVYAQTPIRNIDKASVGVTIRVRDNQLVSHEGSLEVSGTKTSWTFVQGAPIQNSILSMGGVTFVLGVSDTFQFTQPGAYRGPAPSTDPEILLLYNETSRAVGTMPYKLLASLHPVYALRGFEEWGYPITDYPPASLELLTVHDRAIALPNALASDLELKKRLSDRLEELLHISIDYVHVPGKRLKILARSSANKARETLFLNEGMGANQIPFIFIPILLSPPNETILLSEPEVHLHPKRQCDLTRMLLKVAKEENIQFFIETHSEHVLHVILNAIAKHEWEPSQVAIYSFENVNGTARATRLEVDEQGGVKGGLPGFFDQSLDELTEYLEALKKPTV